MFNNLKVGIRLGLGFAILLIMLLAAGFSGIWGVNSISNTVISGLEKDGTIAQKAALLETQSLSLRRYEKDTFLNIDKPEKTTGYYQKWQSTREKFSATLDVLARTVYLAEEKQMVVNMQQAIKEYQQGFQKIYSKIQAKTIVTPQAGNKAMGEYKNPIRQIAENSEKLMSASEQRLQAIKQSTADQKGQTVASIWLIVGIAVLIFAGLSFILTRSITIPIKQVSELLTNMETGNISQRLNLVNKDELGDMARTLDRFADSLQHEVVESLQRLAAGDLTFKVVPHSSNDMLRSSIKQVGEDLNGIISQLQSGGDQIGSASGQVADSSQTLSQSATETASSLEEISSSINEMASQTTQSAENANQANRLANDASKAAASGGQQMNAMVTAMAEINEAGQNISKIIKVIDEIAFQTNLLALNAAVEAARAGQHGKGFAVVAEEVRNLAARSAKAAHETSELIEGSVEKTQNGTQIAEQTSSALDEIVASITQVTGLVAEIAAASNEQAQGIAQINQGLSHIDQGVQQNTATAEESAAAAEELSSQAAQMKQQLGRFNLASEHVYFTEPPMVEAQTPQSVQTTQRPGAFGWGESSER